MQISSSTMHDSNMNEAESDSTEKISYRIIHKIGDWLIIKLYVQENPCLSAAPRHVLLL